VPRSRLLQNLFLQFDVDKSGTMSSYELRTALKAAGKGKLGQGLPAGGHLPWEGQWACELS
jgi:Ca2+-binding EF-hand superfamily protein